jgi:hypothetical protein
MSNQQKLTIIPISFKEACEYVDQHHRHHKRPIGHKFSIGVMNEHGQLVGVAMIGRPVARHYDNGLTLEVNRTATDGTPNANSALYGAAWRAAKALGYTRLITYTQEGETGASLRGAGWKDTAQRPARKGWNTPSRPTQNKNDNIQRTLWEQTI